MKILLLLSTACLTVAPLHATFIPISQTAVSSVSGLVAIIPSHGGYTDNYSDTRNDTWAAPSYAVDITGTASASADPQPGWVYHLPLDYTTSSRARQTASVSSSGVVLTGNVNAQSSAHAQVGSMSAWAQTSADLVFRVDEAAVYSLSLLSSYSHFHHFGPFLDQPDFTLRALDGSLLLTTADLTRTGGLAPSWSTERLLSLAPGDYQLTYAIATVPLANDPLGESSSGSMNIRLTAVPDAGATALLLLLGLMGIAVLKRGAFARDET